MADPYVGKLTYFRVYSGKLAAGSRVLNATNGRTERIGRLLMMHANHREEIEECYAGDIVAGVGLKQTATGDTLSRARRPGRCWRQIEFPEPVIAVAIEPKTKADQEKLSSLAGAARRGGPDLPDRVRRGDRPDPDPRDGRAPPRGDRRPPAARVQRRRQRRPAPGRLPRDRSASGSRRSVGRFVRQTGGRGQFGHVVINLEPAPGEGFDFVNRIKGGAIPTEFIPAVEQGIEEALGSGVKAGYPMVDVRVELDRRLLPRRRLLGDGLQDRRARWRSRRPPAGRSRSCSSR